MSGISIATRADCLDQEKINYFNEIAEKKELWIELGLQSIHEETMNHCNRMHTTKEVENILKLLKQTKIKSCVHIMNSLPGETQEDMLETAKWIAKNEPDAIKIHMLHLIKNTKMAEEYEQHPFKLLSLEQYVNTVVDQLELISPDCIIERLTGDGMAKDLIVPLWTIKKTIVTNEIDKEMVRRNTWQGKKFRNNLI